MSSIQDCTPRSICHYDNGTAQASQSRVKLYKLAERLLLADASLVGVKGSSEEAAICTGNNKTAVGGPKADHCLGVFWQAELSK